MGCQVSFACRKFIFLKTAKLQRVKTHIRGLLKEQPDLGLHYLLLSEDVARCFCLGTRMDI